MRLFRAGWIWLAIALPACMFNPRNGDTFADNAPGKKVNFMGYYNKPSVAILIQVLKDAALDPSFDSNWVTQGVTFTGTAPGYWNSPDPLYQYNIDVVLVPTAKDTARWAAGGLARTRAVALDPSPSIGRNVLTTFDEDFPTCLSAHSSESWSAIGQACASGSSPITNLVSVKPTPADNNPPEYLAKKGDLGAVTETDDYYVSFTAPPDFATFKKTWQFDVPGTDEVSATYYNAGDLGIGREMHCKTYPIGNSRDVVCYVSNYGVDDNLNGVFGVNPDGALNDAVNRSHSFATVAMTYSPLLPPGSNVRFIVYNGKNGLLLNTAKLDSVGHHSSIPNNCLACHGNDVRYDSATKTLSGQAHFLPFDTESFKYSSQAGFTLASQAESFRKLNNMMLLAAPSPAITDLVNGWYAGQASKAGAAFHADYVPVSWGQDAAKRKVYNSVVKPSCRTCHISRNTQALDWTQATDFYNARVQIQDDVCKTHVMPHAEQTLKNFWASPARAHLVGWLGRNDACKP